MKDGAPWAGATGTLATPLYFGETTRVIKMMVWKSVISDVGIKLETPSTWAQPEVKVANTKINEWEELTFVFTGRENPPGGEAFSGVSVFLDYTSSRTQDNTVYFDNITFEGFSTTAGGNGGDGGETSPSDYCEKEVTHLGIPAEVASAIKLTIANRSSNSMIVTIESANADPVDALVIPGDVTGSPSISAEDKSVAGKISRVLTWQAPLSEIALNVLWSKVSFEGNWQLNASNITVAFNSSCDGEGGGEEEPTGPTAPTTAAPVPSHAASDVIAVFSDSYTVLSGTDFNPNWGQATQYSSVAIEGNQTIKLGGLTYQGIAFNGNHDVSEMSYLHVDYWTANSTALNVSIISPGPLENPVAMSVPKTTWTSVDILLTEFTVPNLTEIFQMKFDGNGDVFLDNIYFHKGEATSVQDEEINPSQFTLEQNYPNPFNPTTNINFGLKTTSFVSLEVYTVMGQKVATLVSGVVHAGNHTATFNASELASGLYLYKLTANQFTSVKSMMFIK
jgi:hypothetical protein